MDRDIKIFSGSSNRALATAICRYLDLPEGQITLKRFADGETFSRSITRAWWLWPKSVLARQFDYRRTGVSRPLALGGPLRGLPYVFARSLRSLLRVAGASVERR